MRAAHNQPVKQVLIVEDNPGDALLIAEAFGETDATCNLTRAADAEVAWDLLVTNADIGGCHPDLILLDLNLPKMSGHEFLAQLKSRVRFRSIPVVVLTSSLAARDVAAAYDAHCNAYFCKPATFVEYVQLIRVITAFWEAAVPARSTRSGN